ncbi:MAG: VWA domain-containing protein [Vicinamibacterales bacterium]|nr:VWA domain-containing protein [Vicinamibacterales bacterium]
MLRLHRFSMPARRRARVFAAAAAALLLTLPSGAQTIEREMFVSVLDQADKPVLTLGIQDFVVREDGRAREVLRARRATDVIDIALLVDTSQALGGQVSDLRRGLEAFIARMRPQAQISIVGLGDRPTIYADYTNSEEALAKGVGRIFPIAGAGAYVLDAVGEVLTGFEKRKPERSAVVVVWAGGQEFGTGTYQPLIDGLKARGTALHVVAIGARTPADARTTEGRNRELLFDRGTTDTGGRRDNILTSMATADALERLAAELLGQYRITFARPDALVPPGRTEVAVRPAGLKARGILIPARAAAR